MQLLLYYDMAYRGNFELILLVLFRNWRPGWCWVLLSLAVLWAEDYEVFV